jgi:hypothetical protein
MQAPHLVIDKIDPESRSDRFTVVTNTVFVQNQPCTAAYATRVAKNRCTLLTAYGRSAPDDAEQERDEQRRRNLNRELETPAAFRARAALAGGISRGVESLRIS